MCGRETAGRDWGVQRLAFGVRRSAGVLLPCMQIKPPRQTGTVRLGACRHPQDSGFSRSVTEAFFNSKRHQVQLRIEKKKNDGRSDGPSSRLKMVLLVTRRTRRAGRLVETGRIHQELYKHFDRMVLKPLEELLFV